MRPLNSRYFGNKAGSIRITFNAGSSIQTGYIVKQLGYNRFIVSSDNVTKYTISLTSAIQSEQNLIVGYGCVKATILASSATTYVTQIQTNRCLASNGHAYLHNLGVNAADTQINVDLIGAVVTQTLTGSTGVDFSSLQNSGLIAAVGL